MSDKRKKRYNWKVSFLIESEEYRVDATYEVGDTDEIRRLILDLERKIVINDHDFI